MREIILDTETTGLDHTSGDRIVEIGGVELLNRFPTNRSFHVYINPERPMSADAEKVHGLSDIFLADKPRFAEHAEAFLNFLGDAVLVIHNASFDIGFLNAELARAGHPPLRFDRVVDTLALARRKHPGAPNSLDALCARYGIDNSSRVKHGALLDAELLAEVYIELTEGRQSGLSFEIEGAADGSFPDAAHRPALQRPAPLAPLLSAEERAGHAAFVVTLGEKAIWREYLEPDADGMEVRLSEREAAPA
ncbi:MAG TPA: DNA polymerase III subunit epsilon [Beijerinckiaceae bacterium]|jgi:DNA polymerase-3 subunit epsilon|nr:DNA polymerase III subunit epsilon [Beijerinckiaceae bacterium]